MEDYTFYGNNVEPFQVVRPSNLLGKVAASISQAQSLGATTISGWLYNQAGATVSQSQSLSTNNVYENITVSPNGVTSVQSINTLSVGTNWFINGSYWGIGYWHDVTGSYWAPGYWGPMPNFTISDTTQGQSLGEATWVYAFTGIDVNGISQAQSLTTPILDDWYFEPADVDGSSQTITQVTSIGIIYNLSPANVTQKMNTQRLVPRTYGGITFYNESNAASRSGSLTDNSRVAHITSPAVNR